jgi:ABC-2 type transport system permease protein
MSWGRLVALARKEFIQIWRDPRSLLIVLFMPIMQMALIGYGASLDIKHVPVCVFDREGSQGSQDLLKRFQASEYLDLVRAVASDVQLAWLRRQGLGQQVAAPLSVDARVWFNEDLQSRAFLVPSVVALVMALIGALLSSLTIAREWERGTMEQLISTPVKPLEIMLGKLLPYFVIGLVDAALCVTIGVAWFDVPFRGTLGTLFFTTALFLIVVLGVGYMLSVFTRNQLGASQFALLVTLLPTTLLGGFAFPIDQMPAPIRVITYVVYSRYYITILKAIFLKGAGVRALAMPILALSIYAVVVGALAMRAFRKTLD